MNAIELLKESRDELGAVQYYIPPADETVEMTSAITADVGACQKLAERIDAYLAEPELDAIEIVRQVRDGFIATIPSGELRGALGQFYKLPDSEAAALIEDYGRRVPRAMLDKYAELYFQSYDLRIDKDGLQKRTMDALAAKYGVKMEDAK